MSASNPGPIFMGSGRGAVFLRRRLHRSSRCKRLDGVNVAINVIQISALLVFSVMALGYRMNHPPGSVAWQFDSISGEAYTYEFATTSQMVNGTATDVITRDANMVPQPKIDASGKPVPYPRRLSLLRQRRQFPDPPQREIRNCSAQMGLGFRSGHGRHSDSRWIRIGARRWAARPRTPNGTFPMAVILSLLIQGAFCYLIEYFAANLLLK